MEANQLLLADVESKPVLNRQVLIDLLGEDEVLLRKFEIDFLNQAQQSFNKIVDLFKTEQFKDLKSEAHFLKTSAKAIGAEQVALLLQMMESEIDERRSTLLLLIQSTSNAIKHVHREICREQK